MGNAVNVEYPSAFWGDEFEAPKRLLAAAPDLDYLAMDYLAEITMAILKRQ